MVDDPSFEPQKLKEQIKRLDWKNTGFSLDKAYVCAFFSQLAYRRISEFELEDANRANIIPCDTFQAIVGGAETVSFDDFLKQAELGQYFSTVRRYAIIVGVRTHNVIFISLRGTSSLYDLLVDLDARHTFYSNGGYNAHYHSGFFQAVEECREPVIKELSVLLGNDKPPVYVTGHSLGGAMAAIINGTYPINFHSAYSFGMPRYGDQGAVRFSPTTFHLMNEEDPIPNLPPKWLGFCDPINEFALDGKRRITRNHEREPYDVGNWLYHLATFRPFENHAMELYTQRIDNTLRIK